MRGPKGPSPELISTIVEMKYRHPHFGYQLIADQICQQFDVDLEKDVVVAFSLRAWDKINSHFQVMHFAVAWGCSSTVEVSHGVRGIVQRRPPWIS
jgi:hypothetical protein